MALNGKVILESNLGTSASFENAYVKVLDVSADKNTGNINVGIFESKNGRLICSQSYPFQVNLESLNFIKQSYEQIKKLPIFINCEFC